MAAPDIRSLSAYDLNKIQQSLNQYNKGLEGTPRPGLDRGPGFRSMTTANQAEAAREPFKSGSTYGIEDEYRYMLSQGFRPESMQVAPQQQQPQPQPQQQTQQYKPEQLEVSAQEPVEKGPTESDLAVQRLTDQIAKMQSNFQTNLQRQADMFATQAAEQEKRMSDLQQQMIQSTVMAAERPKTVGVKAATGAAGTQMAIARRGATGAFGRGGMRISSLNV